jgi:hypothetical protein
MRGLMLRVLVFIGLTFTASALYAVPYLTIR